jgi:hypothetical protein
LHENELIFSVKLLGVKNFVVRLKNEFQFDLASWHEMAYVIELHWDTILKVDRQ